jgi:hypothetical protein
MKKLTSIFAVLFLMTLSVNVFAQNTATVSNANASAKIISKITLAQTTPLNFGTTAQTALGGTVTLTAASDVATYSNPDSKINSSTEARALFSVTGETGATYSIVLPTTDVTLTRASGTETMTINGFATEDATTNTIEGGISSFHVGAVLNVGVNQVPGTYNGTYAVTVNYN